MRSARARAADRQPRRYDIIAADIGGDDWLTSTLYVIRRNVPEKDVYAMLYRLEKRNPRIGYYCRSVRRRGHW